MRTLMTRDSGMGVYDFGTPDTNMACLLDPACHDYANAWCAAAGNLIGTAACSSWSNFHPTPAQIAANNTNAGPALTPESQIAATAAAQAAVAADIAANPQAYSELCGTGLVPSPVDGSCIPCAFYQTPSNGVCIFSWIFGALVVGGLIGAGLLISAVKR
jgi:hypothetical protein